MAVFAAGLAALVIGIVGIVAWGDYFIIVLKGSVPVMLILGGALAAYLGFEEIKDKGSSDTIENGGADLKQEVERKTKKRMERNRRLYGRLWGQKNSVAIKTVGVVLDLPRNHYSRTPP